MDTDWYELRCDCDGEVPREIASIFAYRVNGPDPDRIFVRVHHPFSYQWQDTAVNRRGDHAGPHGLRCPGRCGREIPAITDRTVADIIDRISPVRRTLETAPIPPQDQPWMNDLFAFLGTGPCRYVIPFATFCQINTRIGDSR
jgi:hypothetical protein